MFGPPKTHFWVNLLYLLFGPPTLDHLQLSLCYFHFGLKSCQIMTFKPLFGQITILSFSFVTFQVSRFHVSYLTHETFKLRLQNTLNMSKTTRVYFGVLHEVLLTLQNLNDLSCNPAPYSVLVIYPQKLWKGSITLL